MLPIQELPGVFLDAPLPFVPFILLTRFAFCARLEACGNRHVAFDKADEKSGRIHDRDAGVADEVVAEFELRHDILARLQIRKNCGRFFLRDTSLRKLGDELRFKCWRRCWFEARWSQYGAVTRNC